MFTKVYLIIAIKNIIGKIKKNIPSFKGILDYSKMELSKKEVLRLLLL